MASRKTRRKREDLADAMLAKQLSALLFNYWGGPPQRYDPPKECHGRPCTELGRAVMWAAKSVEEFEPGIEFDKKLSSFMLDGEDEAFASAAKSVRERALSWADMFGNDKEAIVRGYNSCLLWFWLEARSYADSSRGSGRPAKEGVLRNGLRLALVYTIHHLGGIAEKEACGAVALAEVLYGEAWPIEEEVGEKKGKKKGNKRANIYAKQEAQELSDNPRLNAVFEALLADAGEGEAVGLSPDDVLQEPWWSKDKIAHMARELLACTQDLRPVEGLAQQAVEKAIWLYKECNTPHSLRTNFPPRCIELHRWLFSEERETLRHAETIWRLWKKHGNDVKNVASSRLRPLPEHPE